MHPTVTLAFLFAAFAAPLCHAADFHKASPPNVVVLAYPNNTVTANQTITLGFDGGGLEVAGDYYGFAWNISVSLVLPNNTHRDLASISNVAVGGPVGCSGTGSAGRGPSTNLTLPIDSAYFNETQVPGTYTAVWNVTYGTSTDPIVANQTSCDLSRLSYETFLFNKTIDIVAQTMNGVFLPVETKEAQTFQPEGFIMSNGAGFVRSSVVLVLVGVLCALLWVL